MASLFEQFMSPEFQATLQGGEQGSLRNFLMRLLSPTPIEQAPLSISPPDLGTLQSDVPGVGVRDRSMPGADKVYKQPLPLPPPRPGERPAKMPNLREDWEGTDNEGKPIFRRKPGELPVVNLTDPRVTVLGETIENIGPASAASRRYAEPKPDSFDKRFGVWSQPENNMGDMLSLAPTNQPPRDEMSRDLRRFRLEVDRMAPPDARRNVDFDPALSAIKDEFLKRVAGTVVPLPINPGPNAGPATAAEVAEGVVQRRSGNVRSLSEERIKRIEELRKRRKP